MRKHVYLVGFMGSGKSTVGPILAKEIGRAFYDLDTLIEKEQKMTISEIFECRDEASFRDLESHQLIGTAELSPCVIALGGGTFLRKSNRDFVFRNGVAVWLEIPFHLARERCLKVTDRPLARDPQRFKILFQNRQPYYQLAEIHVSVQGKSPQEICSEIEEKLGGGIH